MVFYRGEDEEIVKKVMNSERERVAYFIKGEKVL